MKVYFQFVIRWATFITRLVTLVVKKSNAYLAGIFL